MAARKTSSLPTRIWSFTARPADTTLTDELLRTANRYYNALVRIERDRNARYLDIRRCYAPELAALEDDWIFVDDQIETTLRETKRERQKHWAETGGEKRRLLDAATETRLAALRAEQKLISANMKDHRADFKDLLAPAQREQKSRSEERAEGAGPRIKSQANASVLAEMLGEPQWTDAWKAIARSDAEAHASSLAARASCGLATGTYLAIEEAFQRAKKDSLPRPPRFRAYRGGGKLAVQLRAHTAWRDLFGGASTMTLQAAPHLTGKKGDQSRMVIASLDQSVPRGDKQKLIMTVKLHRRPPEDAHVKWASLVVRRVGMKISYELQFTLEHASFAESKRPVGMRSPVHIRIGWAAVEDGVRVAHWGGGGAMVVPEAVLSQNEHAAAIEGASDLHFERIKKMLRRWMAGGPHRLTGWHWMHSDRARGQLRFYCEHYAARCFGEERLRTLWREWVTERRALGADLYAPTPANIARRWLASRGFSDQSVRAAWLLFRWARKDAHLQQYAVDSRRRFVHRRDALFRAEAIRIATEYESVTVDAYKITALKMLPSLSMPGDPPRDQAQRNAQAAAPGRFREILLDVMGARCIPCDRSPDEKLRAPARERKTKSLSTHCEEERPSSRVEL